MISRLRQELQGRLSALIAYPLAERIEKRDIRSKRAELRRYYKVPYASRKAIIKDQIHKIAIHAGAAVPYYKELFQRIGFNPENLLKDSAYLQDLPYLTKDIVREQGDRLLSRPLEGLRHHRMKTGGSTGLSAHFLYDQTALDYSAAVTLYAREQIGKHKHKFELHFASRFPDAPPTTRWTREDWKCLAMNRSNIFFNRLDDEGLEEIWQQICARRPYLAHGHPSTMYALACYVERKHGPSNGFHVFESSGELLKPYMREKIAQALQCRVIDRYGLAELGVMAYELNPQTHDMQVLDSEGWPESLPISESSTSEHELVFTGFRNYLMPLLRYRTGDLAKVEERDDGLYLTHVVGRMHDLVPIHGIPHPTHHIMDILDHRVGGIQEFQIDLRTPKPTLRIVPDETASPEEILRKIESYWGDAFLLEFVDSSWFIRVGHHQKFRHLVHP